MADPSGDVWDVGWWGESGTRPTIKDWAQYLADDIRVIQATEGYAGSSPLLVGVDTVLWPTAVRKSGKWYRGVVDAADRLMRWHWLRHATDDAKSGDKRKRGGRRGVQPY